MTLPLTYNIPEESLAGSIGSVTIKCLAGSGGRAGSKTKDAENWFLKNNAYATQIHHGSHTFGPLPQGSYYMRPHESKPNMVRLDPFSSNLMFGRSGFLIHGRGAIGSHGCIVPYEFGDVLAICRAVRSFIANNKGKPVLQVVAISADLDRQISTA